MKSGYTTGACATAAAKAALLALLSRKEQTESQITLPSGEQITLPVAYTEWAGCSATCTVIKESGDDPDVTNHSRIRVTVQLPLDASGCAIAVARLCHGDGTAVPSRWHKRATVMAQEEYCQETESDDTGRVIFQAGEGVGTVTLPGLGLKVGDSVAIVTVSVPGGEELAKRTFNPKLGIIGGISIIGTSGIVRPFSSDAFIASIRKEASVAKAIGCETLVINSGAKSERYLRSLYASLPPQSFVHYGNFIGETLKIAADLGFKQVILGIMIGKAVKLAEGFLDTHSKKVVMNKGFLQDVAKEAKCEEATVDGINRITLARELWELLTEKEQNRFFPLLLQKCKSYCAPILPDGELTLLLISEEGKVLYQS